MNVLFAGTPEFAAKALEAIVAAGHQVPLVLSQPDRPAGRGMRLHESPVKQSARRLNLPVFQPQTLKTPEVLAHLRATAAEIMVVAAYGLILPKAVLDLPTFGCINIHASLLPRWRGAAPIQRALQSGDTETGITLMQMDEGLDTGPMLSRHVLPILPADTAQSLHDRLALLGAEAICQALARLAQGPWQGERQNEAEACYAAKLGKQEARLDWNMPASTLERIVRAFNPFPVAHTVFRGEIWRVWRASVKSTTEVSHPAGQIVQIDAQGIHVACGSGVLCLEELQRPSAKRMPVDRLLLGHPLCVGEDFDA